VSTETDAMLSWLSRLQSEREPDCRTLSPSLLEQVGHPPIPAKGSSFMSMERYYTFVKAGQIASDTYCDDATREKMHADAEGDHHASEAAVHLVHFWADVNEWLQRTYP